MTKIKVDETFIRIDFNNLPLDRLICEWMHPEYGIIKGNLVWTGGDNYGKGASWYIYPYPDPVSQADISLSEFTHYRKIVKHMQESKGEKHEEIIHWDIYKNLPDSIQCLYKKQWQEWQHGWIDSNNRDYEVVGHTRCIYKLISSFKTNVTLLKPETLQERAEKYADEKTNKFSFGWDKEKAGRQLGFIAGATHQAPITKAETIHDVVKIIMGLSHRIDDDVLNDFFTRIKNI